MKYATHMSSKRGSLGRPVDESKSAAFFETLDWLENNEDEIITIQMLWEKMKEYIFSEVHEAKIKRSLWR